MRRFVSIIALSIFSMLALPVFAGQAFLALTYHDVRTDVVANYDPDQLAVSTEHLAAHFAWLQHHGYVAVGIDDLIAASRGQKSLPDKAVLLTFDDGLKSVYTQVYPLLKIFNYPAVVSVVTDWIGMPAGRTVRYDQRQLGGDDFISWQQAREMMASGLVEIASHSANLHHGIVANPQNNVLPAAISREYKDGAYESDADYRQRLTTDLARSAAAILAAIGVAPRVMTWPYGKYNELTLEVATEQGMPVSLTLNPGINKAVELSSIRRLLIGENAGISEFSSELGLLQQTQIVSAVQVDLDYVYDADPVQQKANLDVLVERIKNLQISHVFLQAFADPDGDGGAAELYFPNRHLPMRADLFNRVAWQLKTRSNVQVYAWMPLLAFQAKGFDPAWSVVEFSTTGVRPDPDGEPRLSPFHADARRVIREIYQDLATHADFDGILLHDDARLNESEDASAAAMDIYRKEFGSDFEISLANNDPELAGRWSRFKTQALIEFGNELIAVLREQHPQLKTARNLFASAVLNTESESWLAHSLRLFLDSYDYVALMAMPYMENSSNPDRYLDQLAAAVAQHEDGFERTIFELQTVDWRNGDAIPATTLSRQMRRLRAAGVKHLAYYPDDFLRNRPALEQIKPGISLADYPFGHR